MSRRNNSHLAVHMSPEGTRVVVQSRNQLGQFQSPNNRFITKVSSSHVTLNGEVLRRGIYYGGGR
jgi:hypothetical protein